jgi:hypothetical protein
MKLKPLLFLAGAAGAAAAVMQRRGQSIQDVASAAPEPVRQAASTAAETVQRAVQTVTPGNGGGGEQPKERYEPPVEAGAQQPASPGGPPSSQATVIQAEPLVSEAGDQLNIPEHGPPEGAVMPDTSDDDALVREQEAAAEGDAGSIGGNVDEMAAADESFPRDPAARPVVEGSGDENEEAFETREGVERGNREIEP